jgi:hypothetical protein
VKESAISCLFISACYLITTVNVYAQGTWETTLRGRDLDGNTATFEAWYDTILNITWLADAGLIKTSGVSADNHLVWDEAVIWIATLNDNSYLGYNNWRLPTLTPVNGVELLYATTFDGTTDRCYNLSAPGTPNAGTTVGEMPHLHFNTLGNTGYYDFVGNPAQPGYGISNSGPFVNLEETGYWNDLEYALNSFGAWKFDFELGYQDPDPKIAVIYSAWPVHSGDIGAKPQGDINMDNAVNTADIILINNYLLGISSLDAIQKAHADVYPVGGDAQITVSDLVLIVRNALY